MLIWSSNSIQILEKFKIRPRNKKHKKYHDRQKWLYEELETLKKVSGDASSIETGLRDWIEQSNASGNTWLKKYKSNYDQKLKHCWYESSKGPAVTTNRDKSEDSLRQMAKNWEKNRDPQVSRHWNSSEERFHYLEIFSTVGTPNKGQLIFRVNGKF